MVKVGILVLLLILEENLSLLNIMLAVDLFDMAFIVLRNIFFIINLFRVLNCERKLNFVMNFLGGVEERQIEDFMTYF